MEIVPDAPIAPVPVELIPTSVAVSVAFVAAVLILISYFPGFT